MKLRLLPWPALLVFALFLGSLAGCQKNTRPETRYVTVSCLSQAQLDQLKDAEPTRVGSVLTGQAQEDAKTIADSAIRLRSWGHGLMGVLEGCAQK